MSNIKPIEKEIPDIFRSKTIDLMNFVWVTASQHYFPNMKIVDGISNFYFNYDISEDEYPFTSAICYYYRENHKYLSARKEDTWKITPKTPMQNIYREHTLTLMQKTWITATKALIPTATEEEAGNAFEKYFEVKLKTE